MSPSFVFFPLRERASPFALALPSYAGYFTVTPISTTPTGFGGLSDLVGIMFVFVV